MQDKQGFMMEHSSFDQIYAEIGIVMRSFYLEDRRLQRGERRGCLQCDSVSCRLFFGYFKEEIPIRFSRKSSRKLQGGAIFLNPEIVKNKSENWDWYLDSTEVFI